MVDDWESLPLGLEEVEVVGHSGQSVGGDCLHDGVAEMMIDPSCGNDQHPSETSKDQA